MPPRNLNCRSTRNTHHSTAADYIHIDLIREFRYRSSSPTTKPASRRPRPPGRKKQPLSPSLDKKLGAFIRDWNLWVRNLSTWKGHQAHPDGVKTRLRHRQRRLEAVRLRHPPLAPRIPKDRGRFNRPGRTTRKCISSPHQRTPTPSNYWKYPSGRRQIHHHE